MSFILDALRKSDQQRHRSATPTLMTAQLPAESTKPPALLWYGVLAAILLGAGILIGGLHQWQSEPMTATGQGSANKSPEQPGVPRFAPPPSPAASLSGPVKKPEISGQPRETATAPVSTSVPAPVPAAPIPATPAATAPVVVQPAAASTVAAAPAVAPAQPETTVKSAAPGTVTATSVATVPAKREERVPATDPAKDSGVINMAELPPSIQQELPKLAILAHSYSSKPKARFVFINDRMVHEEESPAPGLKLEQITPDGMVFSYKGYRFRRNANQ